MAKATSEILWVNKNFELIFQKYIFFWKILTNYSLATAAADFAGRTELRTIGVNKQARTPNRTCEWLHFMNFVFGTFKIFQNSCKTVINVIKMGEKMFQD